MLPKQYHNKEYFGSIFIAVGYHLLTVGVIIICRWMLINFKIVHSIPTGIVSFVISTFGLSTASLIALSGILAAKRRFSFINQVFEDQKILSFNDVQTLIICYGKLNDSVILMNKCFSINLMIHILRCILNIIFLMFDYFLIIVRNDSLR